MEESCWRIKNNLCRCCHTEGDFLNLAETTNVFNECGYARMILDCLNISIVQVPGELFQLTYSICEQCIIKLNDVANFKKQVLDCELRFVKMLSKKLVVADIVKEEIEDSKDFGVKSPVSDEDTNDKAFFDQCSMERNQLEVEVKVEDIPPKLKTRQPIKRQPKKKGATRKNPPKLKQIPPIKQDNSDDELSSEGEEKSGKLAADTVFKNRHESKDIPPKLKTRQQIKRQPKKKGATRKNPPKLKQIQPIKQHNSDDELSSEGEEKSGKQEADTVLKNKLQSKRIVRFYLRESDYTTSTDGSEYTCTRCNKRYTVHCSLRRHVKYKHYNINRYQCPKCSETFKTKVPFIQHKLREHDIDDRCFCNACEKFFNCEVQLKKHRDIFHMLGPKTKCSKCDFETFSIKSLYRHQFKHRTTKDFHCRFCEKKFLRKNTLNFHERIHTGDKRKVCSVCGQAFVQKASLNYHMTKYHPNVN